uniref:phage tail spike protein n=1 Tax=Streptococcus pseudopneumoniae TaxID=257758 RepID=UPI00069F6B2D
MIYLFNQLEELIDVIDEASLAEFTHTIELNQFDRSSFEIPVDYKPDIIKEAQFFGFQSRDRAFCLFRISEKSYDSGLTIEGIDRAESDLHSFIIEDKRPSGTADQVLRGILEGTGYQLGDTNRLIVNGKMSFYYISVRQALVKIIESFGCEFRVRYTFVENKIIGRYIDLYQRFGRKTGHQFEYGSNILNVTYEESSDEVVTALIGRGRGEQSTDDTGEATGGYGRRIQFKDVTWSVSKGDPVDKPAGQNYIANEAARNNYGLHQNGVIKHRFGVYTNENIEDPVELLKATYKELQRLSVPIATFKANLLDLANAIEQDIWIGDSVGIVRDQIGIAFEARIHKLVIDKLDDNRSVAELGDYQTLQAKDRTTRQQAIIDAVSGFSESLIEKAITDEVDRRDKEFDEKMRINKLEFDNALESAKARAEEVKRQLSDTIDQRFSSFNNGPLQEAKRRAEEALRNAGASTLLAQEAKQIGLDSVAKLESFKSQATSAQTALSGDLDALKQTVNNEVNQASEYRRTTTEALSRMTGQMNGFATKSEVAQGIDGLTQTFAKMRVGGRNLLRGSKGPFLPDRKPANFDNNILYVGNTSIYMEQGQEYIISAKTDGNFTAHHDGLKESDNVVLWIMDKDVRNYQIVSDLKTGTTGTKIIWNRPTGIYHLRVNTYHKEAVKSVWDVKIEKGNIATDWSPAIEDVESQITEARTEFKQTADGLSTKMAAVETYVGQDNQRQESLRRYTREESARQATTVRELVARDYVGKATYQEDVRGLERRFEAITNPKNGSIATQIANYKTAVDGRFADITSLLSGKANQTDFQRVQETSKLYERILGNTDNGIANNVARMAMTNQLFQVEVAKNASNGQNLLKGSKNFSGDWKNMAVGWKKHSDKYQGCDVLFKSNSWNGIGQEIDAKIGEIYTFSLWMKSDWKNDTVNFYVNRNGSVEKGWGVPSETSVSITSEWQRYSFTFKITKDGFIFPRVERLNQNTNLYVAGLKLEKGSYATPYTQAPEDTDEAIRTVQSQLTGSWAVQNINSAGDIISGLNLGADGINRFIGKLFHITGETLIDKAVIKSAMVDKLKTANFEAGSVTTVVLDAEAVTAEKLKVDQAFFNKLVANEAYLGQLFAKQAFINRVQSVAIDASQVRSGILSGDRIYGGTIRGANIYGGTLTGHTKIQLGTYGSFDTVDGGLQINVPRTVNSKDGLGVQFIGSYGRGTNVPYGLYIYKDSDLTTNSTALQSDDFIMTVEGYIKAKGIGWFKTDTGSVNGKLTATIGLWNSNNVSLAFGGSGNDIYYSYNGTAYSLWSVVNQHFSDRRLKENIVDCKHKALDYIQRFQFKEYDWKKQEDRPRQAHTKIGLIAQEVQAVDPTLVYENGDTLNLDNLRLTNIALKAIQELALENQKLTHRLE